MAITDRDRKILWARSGNRCAICRQILVADRTPADPESVVGEEAHIVARSPGGPRAGHLDDGQLDTYDNLILLCRVHHKVVDDQEQTYPPEQLRHIKSGHEAWVRRSLEPGTQPEPIQVVDDPTFGPVTLHLLQSGKDVWDVIADASYYLSQGPDEENSSPEACDAADEFLDGARDWGEISQDVMERGRKSVRDAQRSLGELLTKLSKHQLVAYGCRQRRIIKGGLLPPAYYWQAWLVVAPVEDILRVFQEGEATSTPQKATQSDGDGED